MFHVRIGSVLVTLVLGCGGESSTPGEGTGGNSNTGGTSGGSSAGGALASGGVSSGKGGTTGSGGSSAGGALASGGVSSGKGGTTGSGGSSAGGTLASGGVSSGGGAGVGGCASPCSQARECCGDHCVNPNNDPQNCGRCGVACGAGEYCAGGSCITPPCEATCSSGASCCGSECCSAGQLCCDPQGPISRGPVCVTPNEYGTCPVGCAPLCVCASPDTPIATPSGDQPIAQLKPGDLVYSLDRGRLAVVPIARIQRSPAQNHRVVRVVLSAGRALEISPRHPTADGRTFGDLKAGDRLDGVGISSAGIIAYTHDATYDILPASDTGTYFAAGVLIGSTLSPSAPLVTEVSAPACVSR